MLDANFLKQNFKETLKEPFLKKLTFNLNLFNFFFTKLNIKLKTDCSRRLAFTLLFQKFLIIFYRQKNKEKIDWFLNVQGKTE